MHEFVKFEPQQVRDDLEGLAFVTTTHLGAKTIGDTGKDAQDIANSNGLPVWAYDRIGTGTTAPSRYPISVDDYEEYLKEVGVSFEELAIREDLEGLLAIGRSGSGTEVLGAARYTKAPVIGVGCVDAIGWEQHTLSEFAANYASYTLVTEPAYKRQYRSPLMKEPPAEEELLNRLVKLGQSAATIAKMGGRQIVDIRTNRLVWASDISYRNASYIAEYKPEVALQIDIMGSTFVVSPSTEHQIAQIPKLREAGGRPAIVESFPGKAHCSTNNSEFYSGRAVSLGKLSVANY